MIVGCCRIRFSIPYAESLKDKRSAVSRIKNRTRSKFNVSIAETGDLDLWRSAELGVAVVGNETGFVNSAVDHVLNFIDGLNLAEITDSSIEILHL